jgi:ectoine hydroxylase-related dioxygenase (phytanoyl-CoA dioxygenase family)
MVELYQHQALWDNRQHPSVHETFAQIFGTPKLWVSEDRVSMKPPMNPKYPAYNHAGFIHWDVNTAQWPVPFGVQGVLCLTDTTADMGGFRCAPGFYAEVEAWARTQPIDRNPYTPDLKTLPKHVNVVPIPANAGDLIVWNTLTLHGIGLNKSNRPRLAQYISMHLVPAHPAQREAEREKRIHRWRNRLKPDGAWALGDPRHWEELHGTTAVLTPLGRKLLGADDW